MRNSLAPRPVTRPAAPSPNTPSEHRMERVRSTAAKHLTAAVATLLLTASAAAQTVSPQLFNDMEWRLLGPFRGGRAVAVAGVPGDPATFYFGSVGGGVWKTT